MGISIGSAKLWLEESAHRPFHGRILTLGRQQMHFSAPSFNQIAAEAGIGLTEVALEHEAQNSCEVNSTNQYISDRYFSHSLGFSAIVSLDASGFENADHIFDLNNPELPESLVGKFDVVFDGGTMEHIFHLPNVLNNIFRMLAAGGRVIHHAVSCNHIDHGFYMFSPTFFWDYYSANEFDINSIKLIRHTPDVQTDPWELTDYTPDCLNTVSFGGLDDGMYAIHCVASKTPATTGHRIPQQGFYSKSWQLSNSPQLTVVPLAGPAKTETPNTQEPRPLAIRLAKAIVPHRVRRFLRSAVRFLTSPRAIKPAATAKGLQLPVVKLRTKYH
ncbi:MAG: class I SAM-dependent methyltransferase [Gemmataceae bacterium]|nr:class I SAM-dependent methyltransferase [Gemmataceae bacterium]